MRNRTNLEFVTGLSDKKCGTPESVADGKGGFQCFCACAGVTGQGKTAEEAASNFKLQMADNQLMGLTFDKSGDCKLSPEQRAAKAAKAVADAAKTATAA